MIRRLRLKFVCILMALLTLMLGVTIFLTLHFTRANLESESIRTLQSIAMDPSGLSQSDESAGPANLPYFVLELNARGNLVATRGGHFDLNDREMLQTLINTAFYAQETTGELPEYHLRFYRLSTASVWRVVFADISGEQNTMRSLLKTCLLLGAAALLVFLAVSVLLSRWLVKPVARAWEQQRQFVADASHELKTPLTVILTNAELLQSPDYNPEAKAQFSSNILTMSQQMRGLVESLLQLARVDNGHAQEVQGTVCLSKLLSDALLPFEPLLFEQGLELVSRIEDGIVLRGSEAHLRQVADILLDNARKYAAPEGWVLVSLTRQSAHHCLLSVANPGPALSPQEQKDIFKRFYRGDRARSMNQSYGLGLSIAKRIVEEHRGRIWAESSGGINTFFISLPTTARQQKQEKE